MLLTVLALSSVHGALGDVPAVGGNITSILGGVSALIRGCRSCSDCQRDLGAPESLVFQIGTASRLVGLGVEGLVACHFPEHCARVWMELPDSVSGLLLSDQATQGAFFRSSQVIGAIPPTRTSVE